MWIECPACKHTMEATGEKTPRCPSCGFTGDVEEPPAPPAEAPRIAQEPAAPGEPPTTAPARGTARADDDDELAWMQCPACRAWLHVPLGGLRAHCEKCGARIITPH